MVTVRVLKRRDAASVVTAIAVGLAFYNFVVGVVADLTNRLSGGASLGGDWKTNYWRPLVALILQLVVIELALWIYATAKGSMDKK